MRININGVDVNPEEFEKMQEEQARMIQQQYENLRQKFDCNNAVIVGSPGGFLVICSLDRKNIKNVSFCKSCMAYNNKVYIAVEVGSDEQE